jgi:hypothetical protein
MKLFPSARHLKRLVLIHDGIANLYTFPRHAMSSSNDRALRAEGMVVWRQGKAPRLRMAAIQHVDSARQIEPMRNAYDV